MTLCQFADGTVAYGGSEVTACTMDNSTPHQPEKNAAVQNNAKNFSTGGYSRIHFLSCLFHLLTNIHHAQSKAKEYLTHHTGIEK